MPDPPLVVVVAGPNGAGKSTSAPRLLRDTLAVKEFVNADAIALGLSAFQPEAVAIAAGRVMLARVSELARERADFAFETKNFFDLYRDVVDSWQIYDNSAAMAPRLIAAGVAGEPARILDAAAWRKLEEKLR